MIILLDVLCKEFPHLVRGKGAKGVGMHDFLEVREHKVGAEGADRVEMKDGKVTIKVGAILCCEDEIKGFETDGDELRALIKVCDHVQGNDFLCLETRDLARVDPFEQEDKQFTGHVFNLFHGTDGKSTIRFHASEEL